MSTSPNEPRTAEQSPAERSTNPSFSFGHTRRKLTEVNKSEGTRRHRNRGRRRASKRNYQTTIGMNSSERAADTTGSSRLPKRQTSEGCREDDNDLQEGETILDIDAKHEEDTEFVPKLAKKAFESMVHLETVVLYDDAKPLQPAKVYEDLPNMRQRCIDAMFKVNNNRFCSNKIGTHALHLAIYIMDRFIERYHGDACATLPIIAATSTFVASKFEDVKPIELRDICRYPVFGKSVTQNLILRWEIPVAVELHILMAPVAPIFIQRYLQAVDLELNQVASSTARYLSALALSDFKMTGYYYSRIAAAAVFISYNKYLDHNSKKAPPSDSESPQTGSNVVYPEELRMVSNYDAGDVEDIVFTMLRLAKDLETYDRSRNLRNGTLPINIYQYYKKMGVTTTHTLPDFEVFYDELSESDDSEGSEIDSAATEPPYSDDGFLSTDQENPDDGDE